MRLFFCCCCSVPAILPFPFPTSVFETQSRCVAQAGLLILLHQMCSDDSVPSCLVMLIFLLAFDGELCLSLVRGRGFPRSQCVRWCLRVPGKQIYTYWASGATLSISALLSYRILSSPTILRGLNPTQTRTIWAEMHLHATFTDTFLIIP